MVKEDCSTSLIMKLRLEGVVVTHVEHVAEQSSRGKSKLVKQEYSQDVRNRKKARVARGSWAHEPKQSAMRYR